jgi:hypothetical protein
MRCFSRNSNGYVSLFLLEPSLCCQSGKNPAVCKFLGETILVDGWLVTCLLTSLHNERSKYILFFKTDGWSSASWREE